MRVKPTYLAILLAAVLHPQLANAEEVTKPELEKIERMSVVGVRQRLEQAGTLANTIMKTEVIDASIIENKNAVNLSDRKSVV